MVPVCTVPKLSGDGDKLRTGAAYIFEPEGSKSAEADSSLLISTVQVAVPEHAPDQPANIDPVAGTAVNVTDVFSLKLAAH